MLQAAFIAFVIVVLVMIRIVCEAVATTNTTSRLHMPISGHHYQLRAGSAMELSDEEDTDDGMSQPTVRTRAARAIRRALKVKAHQETVQQLRLSLFDAQKSAKKFSNDWHEDSDRRIPHILHQSWRTAQVPLRLANYMKSWRSLLSPFGWSFLLHTDDDNARLVARQYGWFEASYARMSSIQQADAARLLYMHAYGGVYADLDVELLQDIGPLLMQWATERNASAVLGQEPLAHALLLERVPRQICNAVLASARGHPFWLFALQMASDAVLADSESDPVGTTGPRMLERAVTAWQAVHGESARRLLVTAPDAFYPLWDAGQADTFRERCQPFERCGDQGEGDRVALEGADEAIRTLGLTEAVCATCDRLRAEKFTPTVPTDGSSYAAHHWAHSWIDGIGEAFVANPATDVLMTASLSEEGRKLMKTITEEQQEQQQQR